MKERALALDAASKRHKDVNGFLHVDASNISKETVNPYYGREIPGWGWSLSASTWGTGPAES